MTLDLVGRTVAEGRYQIVRQIGQGGMGSVYLARQVAMDREVALKLITGAAASHSPEAAARFLREMKLTAKIEHPNTIRVYDFGEIDGQLYLTMELLRGRSLREVLAEAGRLPLDRIVRIAGQVARALQAAHGQGVVHRDLKPDNVMLIEQYGERDVVKVLDFGVAKSLADGAAGMTATGAVIGTPIYLSPEQAMGKPIDPRSDLYSLGIMLYEMACGRVPFTASSVTGLLLAHVTEPPAPLAQVLPDVHPGLAMLVDELLRKDPAERPPSAYSVEARLEAIAGRAFGAGATLPPGSSPPGSQAPVTRPPAAQVYAAGAPTVPASAVAAETVPSRPRRGRRGAWTLGALAAVGVAVVVALQARHAPAPPPPPPSVAAKPVDTGAGRLAELTGQLASFGDPPPPAACAPDAAVAAAALVLDAREAVARDPAHAITSATAALARCPGFAAAHNVHGNALQKTGRLDDAADAYARALAVAPDYDAPRFNLGVIQLRRKDPAAIASFDEILRRKPDDPDAFKSRAQAYLNAGRYREALADFEAALARAPDDGQAWLIVGQLRDKLHRPAAHDAYCEAGRLGVAEATARCLQ